MALAYAALHVVFREHAGRLKSFKEDKRKILNRTNEILHECETIAEEHMREGRWEDVRRIRAETLERLRKFAPTEDTYVNTWFENQRTYRKRLSDDRRNEARRMKRRTIKTQPDRIHQVIAMLDKLFSKRSRPTDRTMREMHWHTRDILWDITWVSADTNEPLLDWLTTTYRRLLPMVCNA